jgi:hypothetical protein
MLMTSSLSTTSANRNRDPRLPREPVFDNAAVGRNRGKVADVRVPIAVRRSIKDEIVGEGAIAEDVEGDEPAAWRVAMDLVV